MDFWTIVRKKRVLHRGNWYLYLNHPRRSNSHQWFSISPVIIDDDEWGHVIGFSVFGPRHGIIVFRYEGVSNGG